MSERPADSEIRHSALAVTDGGFDEESRPGSGAGSESRSGSNSNSKPDAGMASETGSVTLVGTAHVSADSVERVRETIDAERPEMVAVELDDGRYRQLQGDTPDNLDAGDILRGNTVFQFLAYWMLSYVQTRLGDRFDVEPGADMMAAIDTAEQFGLEVALVDREIQTTIQRFWARMSITEKVQMIGGLALGITDSRAVGVVAGLAVGLIAGPLIGLFGGSLGITDALLVRAAGGAVLGVTAAYLVDRLGKATLGPNQRLYGSITAGVAGTVVGTATGQVGELIVSTLGLFAGRAIGSLGIGILVGLVAGLTLTLLVSPRGSSEPETGGIEELDPEELTDTDVVTMMMEEFRQFSPGGAEALIDERDAFIAHKLLALREAGRDVVAVIGAGHRQGVEQHLEDPSSLPPMSSLVGRETGRGIPWAKLLGYGITVIFVSFFLLLAMAGVQNTFLFQLFGAWFLINAVFAFTFAKVAGARWVSAGVGGAVAWMTSINPLLAPGWFTGYVELRHLQVNVGDIATLNSLLSDETKPVRKIVGDMFDVPLFRLIMVVAMTNVGSVIASFLFAVFVLPAFGAELGGVEGVSQLMLEGARNSADLIWETVTSV